MTGQTDNAITIRFEIRIPTTGGIPTVSLGPNPVTELPPQPGQLRPIFSTQNVSISKPSGGSTLTTWAGTICATGNASGANGAADRVYAKIVQGSVSNPSSVPMSGAAETSPDSSGNWSFSSIGTVSSYPNSVTHTLIVWARFGSVFEVSTVFFSPIWGDVTECDGSSLSVAPSAQQAASTVAFETIPTQWELKPSSFGGSSLSSLNGAWVIQLQTSLNQKVVYCNGGDGSTVPRIQLTCDSPFGKCWLLRFELGDSRVTYSLCASRFNGQGQNVFRDVVSAGVPDDAAIPASITIQPC